MAGMSTALTEFADNGDSRTYTYSGHSASDPRLVIQKRKVPTGDQVMAEFSFSVITGTQDSDGANIPQRSSFQAIARYPITGTYSDVTAALAVFRDIVASDEFTASVSSQNWAE